MTDIDKSELPSGDKRIPPRPPPPKFQKGTSFEVPMRFHELKIREENEEKVSPSKAHLDVLTRPRANSAGHRPNVQPPVPPSHAVTLHVNEPLLAVAERTKSEKSMELFDSGAEADHEDDGSTRGLPRIVSSSPDQLSVNSAPSPVEEDVPRLIGGIDKFQHLINAGTNLVRKRRTSKHKASENQRHGHNSHDSTGSFSDLEAEIEKLGGKSSEPVSAAVTPSSAVSYDRSRSDVRVGYTKRATGQNVDEIAREALTLETDPNMGSEPTATASGAVPKRQLTATVDSSPVQSPARRRPARVLFATYYKQVFGIALLLLTVFPGVPGFLTGLLWGVYLTCLAWSVAFSILVPRDIDMDTYSMSGAFSLNVAGLKNTDQDKGSFNHVVYKGWMNELSHEYDAHKYHVNQTHSVLLRLDKSVLRISRPKQNVLRHSFWNEEKQEPSFVSQKMFDITGAEVALRPKHLARRRWWSRKYPICIVLDKKADLGTSHVVHSEPVLPREPTGTFATRDVDEEDDVAGALYKLDSLAVDNNNQKILVSKSMEFGQQAKHAAAKTASNENQICLYLFARSGREKENWFHRLRRAACYYEYEKYDAENQSFSDQTQLLEEAVKSTPGHSRQSSIGGGSNAGSLAAASPESEDEHTTTEKRRRHHSTGDDDAKPTLAHALVGEWMMYATLNRQFTRFMSSFMPSNHDLLDQRGTCSCDLSVMTFKKDATPSPGQEQAPSAKQVNIAWANALAARIFWDFLRDQPSINKIKDRIQRKLCTVKLPYFMETLTLANLEPGLTVPKVTCVSEPFMNEWGLWVDLKLEYTGGFKLALETKVNLMKLKSEVVHQEARKEQSGNYSDEDVPISPESSADEDEQWLVQKLAGTTKAADTSKGEQKQSTGKKLLNFVDRIAQSKYFQEATDNKYVKKVMQGISDTPLMLMVEVKYLEGTLSLNIPPPPTDRIWYGFRAKPLLTLRASPKVGEKSLSITQVTEFIEGKMLSLFEKNLVIPNMDDLFVPVMSGSSLLNNYNV